MMNTTDLEKDDRAVEWLANIEARPATKQTYLVFLKRYCECVKKTPSELIQESIDELKQGLLASERKSNSYIAKYKNCLTEAGYSPTSFKTGMATIRSFYKSFDIPLSSSSVRQKKVLPMRENRTFINREDVKNLIVNAKNLRERAIILCMATSGMGRQEILNLKVKDITIDAESIGLVRVRREKAQVDYVTFISPEATQSLKSYWEERSRYIKTAIQSPEALAFVTFAGKPIKKNTFAVLFNILGKELGYGNGKGFIKTRSHALRKYFASTLENSGMPKNKIDFMLGHTPSENDLAYFNTDIEKLRQIYINFLPHLTFERVIEVRSLDTKDAERLAVLEQENAKLRLDNIGGMKKISEENSSLKAQMEATQKGYEELKKQMELITAAMTAMQ